MSTSEIETARYEKPVREYIQRRRPSGHQRTKLDLGYEIENQNVAIFEIRPAWDDPTVIVHRSFAKATLINSRNVWKSYWQRADLKWHLYEPNAEVGTIEEFQKVIKAGKYGCFYG